MEKNYEPIELDRIPILPKGIILPKGKLFFNLLDDTVENEAESETHIGIIFKKDNL